MRAIIRVRTNIEEERIDDVLKKHGWIPRIQNQDLLERRRNEILSMVHAEDLEVVSETLLPYTMLDDPTKTWGIVNRPVDNLISFRLKNPLPDHLKTATEKLIRDLQKTAQIDPSLYFDFDSKIEVLEPGGLMHAFSGSVLPINRFSIALQHRITEWKVGISAFVAAFILLMVAIPPLRANIESALIDGWGTWILGFIDRLSTSAIVTGTVSWLNVFMYWFELRRQSVIVWEA